MAFHELATIVERYSPLARDPGINTFDGCDLIDHKKEGFPLSKVGVLVVAARKLKQWESIIGDAFKKRIDEQKQIEYKEDDALALFVAARSQHPTLSRRDPGITMPEEHYSVSETLGTTKDTIVVSKVYLQRLELENHIYRRHLFTYETLLARKWAAIIEKHVDEAVKDSNENVAME
ncbi:MAG: hypothetical protein M1812_000083 [Candelaria pacifica]|nr:MAG: hypothetical protein M1812_000083 [Candelaria pacifica]